MHAFYFSVNFKNHMEQVGTVVKVELPPKNQNHHNNQQQQQQHHLCKGHGVIEYATSQQAKKAIERLSGSMLLGRSILVRYDRPRDPLNFDGWPVRVDQLRPGTPWQVRFNLISLL
jgi:RNA recognition motif-containing protein